MKPKNHFIAYAILLLFSYGYATSQSLISQDEYDSSLVSGTTNSSNFGKTIKAPAFLIAGGFLVLTDNNVLSNQEVFELREKALPGFCSNVDDFLHSSPIAIVYGLNALGVKGKNNLKNRSLLLLKSELIMAAIVFPTKELTAKLRPDKSNYSSFPSGHTAQAFATATFLHKEYGHLSKWYSIGGYVMASSVGILRISNNRHWASDVLVGAGIGILSTQLAYLTHKTRKINKNSKIAAIPTLSGRSFGAVVIFKL